MQISRFSASALGLGLLLLAGCQGPLPTMGPLSSANGSRVPSPATGSFPVPGSYSPSSSTLQGGSNSGLPAGRPLTQQTPIGTGIAPIGTGIVGAVKEEGWHAINEGKVVVANATNNVAGEVQNQVSQAAHAAQSGFARITSRLADETARIADEYAPPVTNSNYLSDVPTQPMKPATDDPTWRKPPQ